MRPLAKGWPIISWHVPVFALHSANLTLLPLVGPAVRAALLNLFRGSGNDWEPARGYQPPANFWVIRSALWQPFQQNESGQPKRSERMAKASWKSYAGTENAAGRMTWKQDGQAVAGQRLTHPRLRRTPAHDHLDAHADPLLPQRLHLDHHPRRRRNRACGV